MPDESRVSAAPPEVGARPAWRVAAVQMVTTPDVQENLRDAEALVDSAAAQGAKLIVLPEYFGIMGMKETDKVAQREREGEGVIQSFLSRKAREHGVWVVGGSVPLESELEGRVFNSCMVYDAAGRLAMRYNKIHLFGLDLGTEKFSEARTIVPGDTVKTVDTPYGKLGLSICYDVRFPELYRAMGMVDVILVPAAFTATTGKAHWETLLRARAIENQAYVVAAAQGGHHRNGRETHGHSMIIDPWGEVIACRPREPGVVIADIDPTRVERVRASLPALAHRTLTETKYFSHSA